MLLFTHSVLCVVSNLSLFLQKKKKEKVGDRAAVESLEVKLKKRAETLDLCLEQKTKDMKQRDKKVNDNLDNNFY